MRTALDDLRAALVLIDGGTGSTLVRSAIATLELEHAANADRAHAARHVPVVPGENLYRRHASDRGASAGFRSPADAVAHHAGTLTELPPHLVQHVSDCDPS